MHPYNTDWLETLLLRGADPARENAWPLHGRDVQPGALVVIGRHYINEHDSAPVQYNGIV